MTTSQNGDIDKRAVLFKALDSAQVFRLGEFYLKSGQMTPIYIDLRRLISYPRILKQVAIELCDVIKSRNLTFDYIVGVPYAAIPIATLVSEYLDVPMLLKRKEAKSYGTKQLIEGVFEAGKKALLIEDVVVHGDSIKETILSLREEGLEVTDAVAVLDRQQGAIANLAEICNFHSALTLEGVLQGMVDCGQISDQRKGEILEHLRKPF